MVQFQLNGEPVKADVPADTPLLWVIRDHFKLKGSKYGCGMGLCGACTMHVDGVAMRTCVMPVSAIADKAITTIEGLGTAENLHPLQERWIALGVPQCGYCQSGQIMSAAALLDANASPTEVEVEQAMAGNICRCGCYPLIKQAIVETAAAGQGKAVAYCEPAEQAGEVKA